MMKVIRSAVHRLEVELKCGCKGCGEYNDQACKQQRGETTFTPCETHKDAPGLEFVADTIKQMVEKEAKDTVIPPTIHPRTRARMDEGELTEDTGAENAEATGAPVRTIRTSGSTGQVRAAQAPAAPRAVPGSHRPTGVKSGGSPFRRADGGVSKMSPQAQRALAGSSGSKVASAKGPSTASHVGTHPNPSGITFGEVSDVEEVSEDPRVTKLLQVTNALGDEEEGDGDEDFFD